MKRYIFLLVVVIFSPLQGSDFYSQQAAHELVQSVQDLVKQYAHELPELNQAYWQNSFVQFEKGGVVAGTQLSKGEIDFTEQRLKESVQFFQKLGISKPLRIALICSGGGPRSQFYYYGLLRALKESNFLPLLLYVGCLSGSGWPFAPLTQLPDNFEKTEAEAQKRSDVSLIKIPPFTKENCEIVNTLVVRKAACGGPLSLVDFYACMLHNRLFYGVDPAITLSSKKTEMPYPVFTALIANTKPYSWIEFTPDSSGTPDIANGAFIPTNVFGSVFDNGELIKQLPPQLLAYIVGLSSAAFAGSIKDIQEIVHVKTGNAFLDKLIDLLITKTPFGDIRLLPGIVNNFMYGMKECSIKTDTYLHIMDAGYGCNIALPPLLRKERKIDAYLIFDTSQGEGAVELIKAIDYAHRKGIKLPKIEEAVASKSKNAECAVFGDDDVTTPVIMYQLAPDLPSFPAGATYTKEDVQFAEWKGQEDVQRSLQKIITVLAKRAQLKTMYYKE